jgi:hypothetical protein
MSPASYKKLNAFVGKFSLFACREQQCEYVLFVECILAQPE